MSVIVAAQMKGGLSFPPKFCYFGNKQERVIQYLNKKNNSRNPDFDPQHVFNSRINKKNGQDCFVFN